MQKEWDCGALGEILARADHTVEIFSPRGSGGATATPAMWAASSILVNQPHGYAEMGIFSAANQWRNAVAFLPALLSQPLLSMLSNLSVGDSGSFRKLLRANLLLSFGLSLLIAAPIVVCSSWILKAYGGGLWSADWFSYSWFSQL